MIYKITLRITIGIGTVKHLEVDFFKIFGTLQKKKITNETNSSETSKFISKLIVDKFNDRFLSPSVITDGFRVNLSVNSSINLAIDDIHR